MRKWDYMVQKKRADGTWYTFFSYYTIGEAKAKVEYEQNRDEDAILRIVNVCKCGGVMHLTERIYPDGSVRNPHYECEECHAVEVEK